MAKTLRRLGVVVLTALGWALALLAFLVVLSYVGCSVQAEQTAAREEDRRAACVWTDPLIVSISGTVLAIPATGRSYINAADGTYLPNETIDGPRAWPRRYAFCLDAPQAKPIEATQVEIRFDAAKALAAPFGLETEHLLGLAIKRGGSVARAWPEPTGDPGRLGVYHTFEAHGWQYLAAGGTDPEGFRTGAKCSPTHDGRQSCSLRVEDAETGLSYEVLSLWIDDRDFDGAPVPAEFLDTARKFRAFVQALEEDAVEARGY